MLKMQLLRNQFETELSRSGCVWIVFVIRGELPGTSLLLALYWACPDTPIANYRGTGRKVTQLITDVESRCEWILLTCAVHISLDLSNL